MDLNLLDLTSLFQFLIRPVQFSQQMLRFLIVAIILHFVVFFAHATEPLGKVLHADTISNSKFLNVTVTDFKTGLKWARFEVPPPRDPQCEERGIASEFLL
jgi:hypothetical protein